MNADETHADIEQVIWLAYKEGYFGPVAYVNSPMSVRMLADMTNLMHRAAGGLSGDRIISKSERTALVAALEELFGQKYHFDVRPGRYVRLRPLENVFWRSWDLGPFNE